MAEENNGNDNTEVNEDEEQDPTTVTLHVGTQADELGVGGEGIDVMDMAGGQDYVASSGGGQRHRPRRQRRRRPLQRWGF